MKYNYDDYGLTEGGKKLAKEYQYWIEQLQDDMEKSDNFIDWSPWEKRDFVVSLVSTIFLNDEDIKKWNKNY